MKLLTKEILNKIPKLYAQDGKGDDAIVYVKFFHPASRWTWYATEFDGVDTFFGFVVGSDALCDELGYFSLSELKSVNVRGLGIERDMHFGTKTLRQAKEERTS